MLHEVQKQIGKVESDMKNFSKALDKKKNLLKMLNPVVANDDNKCSLTIDQRTDKREYLVLI